MEKEMVPCRYCKCQKAETYSIDGLWYVRCRGAKKGKDGEIRKCSAWSPYEFLGLKEQDAINNWNDRNSSRGVYDELA